MDDLDLSLPGPSTSKSEIPTANEPQRETCFLTPKKKDGSEFAPRRSPRVSKPRVFHDHLTPEKVIELTKGQINSPLTVPSSPTTPDRSKVTSTPMTTHEESDADTQASPILEALSTNDSFIAPSSISKVLMMSPRKTPSKNRPLTLGKTEDKTWPSPYKSHRPKYLPKNVNLVKKKRLERIDFIEKAEKFDAQLEKLPIAFTSPLRPVNPIPSNDGDVMGSLQDLFVIFHPDNFFVTFDEGTFDSHFDVNMTETMRSMKLHSAKKEDCRALTLFLAVTSDPNISYSMSTYVEDFLEIGSYFLDWGDLKTILVNFGLSKGYCVFDTNAYYSVGAPKSPEPWNFEFVFMAIKKSFRHYKKGRLIRLVKFLGDCLFEPVLLDCRPHVVFVLREVLEYLIQNGATPQELAEPLDYSYYSCSSNRVILQSISTSPLLKPVVDIIAYRTILEVLGSEYNVGEGSTLTCIANLLTDVQKIRTTTNVKDVYQVIIICENIVARGPLPFDGETKMFLEKLADFAERMSLGYSYFENLYFTDTVTRLRTLSSINGL